MNIEREISKIPICHGKPLTKKRYIFEYPDIQRIIDLFMYYYVCDECEHSDFGCMICDRLHVTSSIIEHYSGGPGVNAADFIWDHLHKKHVKDSTIFSYGYIEYKSRYQPKRAEICCLDLLNNYCQLEFIKQADTGSNTETIIEAVEDTVSDQHQRRLILIGSVKITGHTEFCGWFCKFIENCNYKCVGCKMRYEDGLPSIEMVAAHIYECIAQSQFNEISQ